MRFENERPIAGYVRFELDEGRLVSADVFIPNCRSATTLRTFPLTDVEAWVNDPDIRDGVVRRLSIAGPLLATAAEHFATTFGPRAPATWARDMMQSQWDPSVPTAGKPLSQPSRVEAPSLPNATLEVPPSRPYGDDFYRSVAVVYTDLAKLVRDPVGRIADANHVKLSQAQKWVRVARERQFLGPGRRGSKG